jgi:cytoskeletal protein RodZ
VNVHTPHHSHVDARGPAYPKRMSTLRTPVGPQPPSVYWKRRAMVLLGLVAVIVVIVLIVNRPPADQSAPLPQSSSTKSADEPVTLPECDPEDIALTAETDQTTYASDEEPQIAMTITNTSATDCTFNVGTDVQEYRVTSGSDRIWSSKDCQTGATAAEVTLAAGVPQETTPFPWDRTRSSTSTCDSDRPEVTGGGASYFLTVYLGDLKSDPKLMLLK